MALGLESTDGTWGVLVFYGNPQGRLDQHVEQVDNPGFYNFGVRVYGGDFNGDGFADLLAGSVGYPQVFHGSAAGLEPAPRLVMPPLGYEVSAGFGTHLAIQGDLNGDGFTDLATSGSCADAFFRNDFPCYNMFAYLYTSSRAGVTPMWVRMLMGGYGPRALLYRYASVPGDMNGDGFDDLVIGTPNAGDGGQGGVVLYLGGAWDWTMPSASVVSPGRMLLALGEGMF